MSKNFTFRLRNNRKQKFFTEKYTFKGIETFLAGFLYFDVFDCFLLISS